MVCWECKGSLVNTVGPCVFPLDKGTLTVTDVPFEQCTQCGERWLQGDVMSNIEKAVMQFKNTEARNLIVSYLKYHE